MSLRISSLALLATVVGSAIAVTQATATAGGHFVSDSTSNTTTFEGEDSATDKTQFTLNATFECHTVKYHGMTTTLTATEIALIPTYSECTTTLGNVTITMNGCNYRFTVRATPEANHSTVHLICPNATIGPEIHMGFCTLTITPNQTLGGGIVYKTGLAAGKHDITAEFTINLQIAYHGGFFSCGVAETAERTGAIHGTTTIWGRDVVTGNPVNVTAT